MSIPKEVNDMYVRDIIKQYKETQRIGMRKKMVDKFVACLTFYEKDYLLEELSRELSVKQ